MQGQPPTAKPRPRPARRASPVKGQAAGRRPQVAAASGEPARGGCPRCAYKGRLQGWPPLGRAVVGRKAQSPPA
ncbi:hypothetical protein BHM03_00060337 [Ensete ventricosum]|nr:hypothetical protein BHM03_00060337 [Ensete ventricosum]